MAATARLTEFAAGTGSGVLVERKGDGHLVHVNPECNRAGKHRIGIFATEKVARAAVAGVRACKHCRTTN